MQNLLNDPRYDHAITQMYSRVQSFHYMTLRKAGISVELD
jgi:hypothetical protein